MKTMADQTGMAKAITTPRARAIAVLGMHRSGTSALTGSLAEAGIYLGHVLGQSIAHNRKGLQEPASVLYMQENLLQANGGSWDNPPSTIEWGKLHVSVRDLFLESREGFEPWAFKDPRTLLTLEGWLDVRPDLELVGIFRDPLAVAHSLKRRNGFTLMKGFSLWQVYNERLLHWAETRTCPLIEFSTHSDEMAARLNHLIRLLGLTPPAIPEFFDAALPKGTDDSMTLPADIAALYSRLQGHALA